MVGSDFVIFFRKQSGVASKRQRRDGTKGRHDASGEKMSTRRCRSRCRDELNRRVQRRPKSRVGPGPTRSRRCRRRSCRRRRRRRRGCRDS